MPALHPIVDNNPMAANNWLHVDSGRLCFAAFPMIQLSAPFQSTCACIMKLIHLQYEGVQNGSLFLLSVNLGSMIEVFPSNQACMILFSTFVMKSAGGMDLSKMAARSWVGVSTQKHRSIFVVINPVDCWGSCALIKSATGSSDIGNTDWMAFGIVWSSVRALQMCRGTFLNFFLASNPQGRLEDYSFLLKNIFAFFGL